MKSIGSGMLFLLSVGACALFPAPPVPSEATVGCYSRSGVGLSLFDDSLGYRVPDRFELRYLDTGQWTVLPTGFEFHPYWTPYDELPSTFMHRRIEGRTDRDVVIGGDSIDVRFPGDHGVLTLRLGLDREVLGGRAEWDSRWVREATRSVLVEGYAIATPTECDLVPVEVHRSSLTARRTVRD